MSLTFEAAVDSLSAMFPAWDREALSSLLISNQGRVETTIETVLVMEGGPAALQINSSQSEPESLSPPASEEAAGALQQPKTAASREYRGTKCHLPEMFLRLPNYQPSSSSSRRILADEELALMLQNEMFQRELIQQGYGRERVPLWDMNRRNPSNSQGANNADPLAIPDMGIMKGLSSMGEAAKRNLSSIAMRFSAAMEAQKQSSNNSDGRYVKESEMKPLVGGGGRDDDDEDDDEDEIISFEDPASDGRDHFLNSYGNRQVPAAAKRNA